MSMPYVEAQRSTMVSDVPNESGDADLLVNNLVYEQPKALSLAVNRTYNNQYFQRSDYTGSKSTTCIIDWNSGTQYINTENSFLTFKLTVTGGDANFGSGSAMNIFNEIRIKTRSGVEIDRLELANLWSLKDSTYQKPDSYLKTMGTAQGFSANRLTSDPAMLIDGVAKRFCLPLSVLSPFFRPMKKQLLPPQLASGLKVEMVLEDFRTALVKKSITDLTGYTISDIRFVLDAVDLTDDTQRTINMESASEGLEYAYERIYTSVSNLPAGQLSLSAQVQKAVSQACFATAMTIKSDDRVNQNVDSFASTGFPYKSYQFRLGSLYFPHQRVLLTDVQDASEPYTLAMSTYDKLRHIYAEPSLNLDTYKQTQGVIATSFEKDQNLNMSGLPINNSRVLELNLEYLNTIPSQNPTGLDVIVFLQYCSVSRSYIDNTAVAS